MENITIIGIDCATQNTNIGLALATYSSGNKLKLKEVTKGSKQINPINVICGWCEKDIEGKVLFALDAPLGWPQAMSQELANHKAGNIIKTDRNTLFCRKTDRMIKKIFGKTPLEVGANFIARTAHRALEILNAFNLSIPLVWKNDFTEEVGAIEVYPGATLISYFYREYDGYKKSSGKFDKLRKKLEDFFTDKEEQISSINTDHELDALICCIAAKDFLDEKCITPIDAEISNDIVEKEGWIWVKTKCDINEPYSINL
ncbi:DUF429 domain-containing protein [bacterium]|nr:DUF429 domain-containing protein [bacterium]